MTTAYRLQSSRTIAPVLVDAIEPVPGLIVHPQSEELLTDPDYTWRIGHHSGLALAKFVTSDDALNAAELIADFTDWTRDADEIRADNALNIARLQQQINTQTRGLFIHTQPIA
jgi:hypothetical protein